VCTTPRQSQNFGTDEANGEENFDRSSSFIAFISIYRNCAAFGQIRQNLSPPIFLMYGNIRT